MQKEMNRRMSHLVIGIVFGFMVAMAPTTSKALEPGAGRAIGLGLGAAGANLLYIPTKILYAGTGSIIGGLAWLFAGGDADVSDPIFTASWLGDYVLTEAHLTGERPIEFVGRPHSDRKMTGSQGTESSQGDPPPAASEGF